MGMEVGTHCAGIAAGRSCDVAKQARIIAVKVVGNNGVARVNDLILALEWIFNRVDPLNPGTRLSVVSWSLACVSEFGVGIVDDVIDTAIQRLVNAGIHVVVAAGNGNEDAVGTSPARLLEVTTVGACTIENRRAHFSNYGSVVDFFAPGLFITSVRAGTANQTITWGGTSMACPHVAGIVANLLRIEGKMTPAQMQARLMQLSRNNAVILQQSSDDDDGDYAGTTTRMVYHPPPLARVADVATSAASASVMAARAAAAAAEAAISVVTA